MAVATTQRFKFFPDEVFQNSALLQQLEAAGLYDQNAALNFAPPFQVFSEQVFAAQGYWGTAFFESSLFKDHVADKNAIELPREILEAIIMDPHRYNRSKYREYTANILRHIGDRATGAANTKFGTAFSVPKQDDIGPDAPSPEWMREFMRVVCSYVLSVIDKLGPDLRSGAIPLSSRAPGFKPPPA
jgi:hypothetical protein